MMLSHPLHQAAYFLNPKYHYSQNLYEDNSLKKVVHEVYNLLFPDCTRKGTFGSEILRRGWNVWVPPRGGVEENHDGMSEVSFSIGTHLIPHPNKVDKGGEDAFFVSSYNGGVLAIADGVSGWAERDVDPALFSQELMANASYLVEDEEVDYDPQILLRKAHAATSSIGSATVIVAMLEKNGTLKIANVGDCGLRVLRKGQVVFSTSPQEHSFDCPYQLSSEVVGQTYQDAMVCSMQLMEGDIIVMGSDGLFDNVFDNEIVSTISRFRDASETAKALADLASNHSKDINFDSPYSLEARSRGFDVPLWKKVLGMKLTGGKLDDITVIVGHVVSN